MATSAARSILNGVVGDHLEETGNSLAIGMAFYRGGEPLDLSRSLSEEEASSTKRKVCILVHGLTDDESTWSYKPPCGGGGTTRDDDDDYGQSLKRDFEGIAPFYLRYNTGLHVSTNGRHLDRLLESLLQWYPCEIQELIFLCHSMGGLVVRSACLDGSKNNSQWVRKVGRVFFLGTPHQGSYWEKAGNVVSNALGAVPRPYMRLAAQVANLRSAGIKDLRYGYVVDEDWEGLDPDAFLSNTKKRADLLPWATYHIITGTVTKNPRHLASLWFGDALVHKASAEGRSQNEEHDLGISPDCIREFPGVGHIQLASDPNVYLQIKHWIEQPWSATAPEWEGDTETSSTPNTDELVITEKGRKPSSSGKWAQFKGLATLVHAGVHNGVTAVEGVQHELTNEVYTVLSTVTPIRPVVQSIQTVHEACVGGVYSIIRGVNHGVGGVAKLICDRMDEEENDDEGHSA